MIIAKVTLETKVQCSNSSGGRIGSLARVSTKAKITANATVATSNAMPMPDVQP